MCETTFKNMISNIASEGRLTSEEQEVILDYVDFLIFMRG